MSIEIGIPKTILYKMIVLHVCIKIIYRVCTCKNCTNYCGYFSEK